MLEKIKNWWYHFSGNHSLDLEKRVDSLHNRIDSVHDAIINSRPTNSWANRQKNARNFIS